MSLTKPFIRDNALPRILMPGDLEATQDVLTPLTTVGSGTILAQLLAASILYRTGPVGAYVDTTDTATNIISQLGYAQQYDSYRFRFVNTVAFACTFTGGVGVTVVNPTINASSVKDFLVQITSAAPQTIVAASQTNASAVVTGMTLAQTNAISIGQSVTGTGIPGSTTVIGIQSGVGVTLSANATSTAVINALTFSPTVTITGIGQGLL